MTKWMLVGMIVACNACGDLMNAKGMRRHGEVHDFRPRSLAALIRSLIQNPLVIGGVFFMGLAFFSLMALFSVAELSFAVPATGSSYVVETVLAKLILKERVHWKRWAGACLVAGGVVMLAL